MIPEIYTKWIAIALNSFAIGAAGWIYKAYIQNLQSSISAKEEQTKIALMNMTLWKDKAAELEKKTPDFVEKILNDRIKIREEEIKRLNGDQESHKEELKIQQQELNTLKSELEKTKDVNKQLFYMGEYFEDPQRRKDFEIEEIGVVGVDSGQLMITDPCYIDSEWKKEEFQDIRLYKDKESSIVYQYLKDFNNYNETIDGLSQSVNELLKNGRLEKIEIEQDFNYSYKGACAATLSKDGFGELKYNMGHKGAGLAFKTLLGDGEYSVYAEKHNGEMIRVYVNLV